MKILKILIVSMLAANLAFAQAPQITGYDYLKLSKRQRVVLVNNYKANAKKEGIIIKKETVFYCKGLDAFYGKHPDMKKEALAGILKTLIVMEYDWDQKGVSKDALAKQWLGEQLYEANKARFNKK